jgi:hypothetical protein
MNRLFGEICFRFLFNYIDDLLIYSGMREEHLLHERSPLPPPPLLQAAGVNLNPTQVMLAVKNVDILGHVAGAGPIQKNPSRSHGLKLFEGRTFQTCSAFHWDGGFMFSFHSGFCQHCHTPE